MIQYSVLSFLFAWIIPSKNIRNQFRKFCSDLDLQREHRLIKKRQPILLKQLVRQAKTRKLKVVFLTIQNTKWSYQPLYEMLDMHPNFDVQILTSVGKRMLKKKNAYLDYKNLAKTNYDFFRKRNMKVSYAFDFIKRKYIDLKHFKPDIIFYE